MSAIPIEVSYKTIGNKKTRTVIGVICPTALNQSIGYFKAKPIYVEMGDIKVDWDDFEQITPGVKMLLDKEK